MKKFRALALLLLVSFITLNLWIASKPTAQVIFDRPLVSLSQIFSLLGIVLLSFTTIISTKLKFIENFFSGLDKAYGVHRIAGSLGFIFILSHPLLLAVQALPQANLAVLYLIPSQNLAYTLGVFAIYTMILSFTFMVFIKLPYHIWVLTHKLMGVAFLLGSVHALIVGSDIGSFLPLKIWLGLFIFSGLSATIYSMFFYRKYGPKFKYQIEKVVRDVDVVTIFLRPTTDKILNFQPGQFVYVEFKNKKIGRELHTFSIASDPKDSYLQLSAKIVGDYTLKLAQHIEVGNTGLLYGPYGQFAENTAKIKNSIWIAGGIGATPFLSMLSSESESQRSDSIHLFYTYSKKEEGTFLNQIQSLVLKAPHVKFIDWCTQEKGRLKAEKIKNYLDIGNVDGIFLCGPLSMMEGLKKQFLDFGVAEKNIYYENFSFLS